MNKNIRYKDNKYNNINKKTHSNININNNNKNIT